MDRLEFLKDLDDFYLNYIVKLVENNKRNIASIGDKFPFKNLSEDNL